MPAGQRGVVVAGVAGIPAEHHTAETESGGDRGEQLFLVDVLAAQHAVDVGHGHLDAVGRRVADFLEQFFVGRLFHGVPWHAG
jgi:hypothetical protein